MRFYRFAVIGVLVCALTAVSSHSCPAQTVDSISKISAVVIHPYRSANIGAEVSGIVESIRFREGEKVDPGDLVATIKKDLYEALANQARERTEILELRKQRAEEELRLKNAVFSRDATTRQKVLKAENELEISVNKLQEARFNQTVAELNLKACQIRAPYGGYLAVRYIQPYEPVKKYEKIASIVDVSKVYAVANASEEQLERFKPGSKARFTHALGEEYLGKVDKVAALMDPKSGTAKVYVLLDNKEDKLRVGARGSLESME
jgi:multidrug efflux system membrane fusion protein